jgi:hypothetical protein
LLLEIWDGMQIEGEHLEHFKEGLTCVLERGLPGCVEQSLKLLVLVVLLQTSQGFDFSNGFHVDMQGCSCCL